MLPTLSVPEFQTVLPSTGKKITFRPFLVREEKILLIALEDGEKETIIKAVLDLLRNCIIDEIDVDNLATFDVEYLFMQIRSKSVSEQIEMMLRHGQGDCEAKTKVKVDVEKIKVTGEISDGKIELTDKIGIKLKYPSYSVDKTIERDAEHLFELISNNVEYIYDQENVYDEFTKEELIQWIDHLNKDQFEKVLTFFTEAPSLRHNIEWECKECGKKDYAIVEGLRDFFMLV